MNFAVLSEIEMDILKLLWQSERPLSRAEIFEGVSDKKKHPTAINQILNNMMAKDVICVAGLVRCGKIYGRTYAPTMSREEFLMRQAQEIMPDISPETRFLRTVSAWSEGEDISAETLKELEELLRKRREELRQESELKKIVEAYKRESDLE